MFPSAKRPVERPKFFSAVRPCSSSPQQKQWRKTHGKFRCQTPGSTVRRSVVRQRYPLPSLPWLYQAVWHRPDRRSGKTGKVAIEAFKVLLCGTRIGNSHNIVGICMLVLFALFCRAGPSLAIARNFFLSITCDTFFFFCRNVSGRIRHPQ